MRGEERGAARERTWDRQAVSQGIIRERERARASGRASDERTWERNAVSLNPKP